MLLVAMMVSTSGSNSNKPWVSILMVLLWAPIVCLYVACVVLETTGIMLHLSKYPQLFKWIAVFVKEVHEALWPYQQSKAWHDPVTPAEVVKPMGRAWYTSKDMLPRDNGDFLVTLTDGREVTCWYDGEYWRKGSFVVDGIVVKWSRL